LISAIGGGENVEISKKVVKEEKNRPPTGRTDAQFCLRTHGRRQVTREARTTPFE